VVQWITKTFVRDTAAYFFDADQRKEIQARLRNILRPSAGPYIVIAHSQGSIIAYDVLRELAEDSIEVPLLVTIGSPLGLDEVQDHLRKPLVAPHAVAEWCNFADRLDPVAADSSLGDEFPMDPPIQDVAVVNRDTLRISGFNPHSGSGYLATEAVRQMVGARVPDGWVSPISKFVIARDVATEMADPRTRVAVLIELKSDVADATLEGVGDKLERTLRKMADATPRGQARSRAAEADDEDPYQIDRLRRYISANLTADEISNLAIQHKELEIVTMWKNSTKRALLDRSTEVVQARTAHLGYGATGRGIAWAVLDTGIAANHPHFAGASADEGTIAKQWDCTRPGKPVEGAPDKDGHGTHVAGIIAGRGKNSKARFAGMAPDAKLHIYRVLGDDGTGKDAWIIKAIDHIASVNDASAELAIHGVNLSLGGPFDESVFGCGFSPICRELRRLWRQGVVVCIAAGNEGHLVLDTADGEQRLNLDLSIGDPANLEEAIAVGSVHRDSPHLYGISYFSSRGPTADGRPKPDVVAPGERIISCNARFRAKPSDSEYVEESGTSMACPHVSGLLAAFLSVRREFIGNPDRVKQLLMANCTDLGRDRYHQGAGLPNLVKMLMAT
jgi:subtilisin family serine protease